MPNGLLAAALKLVVAAALDWCLKQLGREVKRREVIAAQAKIVAEMMASLAKAQSEEERRRATDRISRGSF
jgi:hypothetical protein